MSMFENEKNDKNVWKQKPHPVFSVVKMMVKKMSFFKFDASMCREQFTVVAARRSLFGECGSQTWDQDKKETDIQCFGIKYILFFF